MLSEDVSFTEALSNLNVGDLLKDFDEKSLLKDVDSVPYRKRKNSSYNQYDVRKGLKMLSKKADTCERLLESLNFEDGKPKQNIHSFNYNSNLNEPLNETGSILKELKSLRESNLLLAQIVEKLRNELAEERRIRELYWPELKATQPQTQNGNALLKLQKPINSVTSNTQDVDSKYKDLKKKLLMANLKIMELQNKKGLENNL